MHEVHHDKAKGLPGGLPGKGAPNIFTPQEFADRIGISQAYLSNVECGKVEVGAEIWLLSLTSNSSLSRAANWAR